MGEFVFLVLALLFLVQILILPGAKKLPWFFAGILFFPNSIIIVSSPLISFPRLMIYGLMAAYLFQDKIKKKGSGYFPLYNALIVVFISLLLIGFFDNRIDIFFKFYRPFNYFLENFLIIFLTWFFVKSIEDVKTLYNFLVICLLGFSMYGIVNYLTGHSDYNSFISATYNTVDFGNRYTLLGDTRFRISSFAWHPIYYGMLLALIVLLIVFLFYEAKIRSYNKGFYIIAIILIFLNLVWTNSRTPLLSLFGGGSVFFIFGIRSWNKFRLALIGFVVFVGVMIISPDSLNIIDESINTFTSQGSKLEGSSVEMRDVQMGASLVIFSQNPLFGNGFNYISENLGYSADEKNRTSDVELFGFESYSYKLLIEQGLAGIFGNLFFFISLTGFLYREIGRVNLFGKSVIYLSAGMTVTFLLFIFGTGDMGGFMFFMSLMGINIKAISLSREPSFIDKSEIDNKFLSEGVK